MNIKNIWKAWVSTLIGLFIPTITAVTSKVLDGSIDWKFVKTSLIVTALLAFSDLLNEVKKSLNDKADELNK